jgi:hypothetical protein
VEPLELTPEATSKTSVKSSTPTSAEKDRVGSDQSQLVSSGGSSSTPVLPGLATPPMQPRLTMQDWPRVWSNDTDSYLTELLDKTLVSLKKNFGGLESALTGLQAKLKSPEVSGSECRVALEQVRTACRKEGAHPASSSFPTSSENNLIEYINAKLLWQAGDTALRPGATIETRNKKNEPKAQMKPDYLSDGGLIGDCVRIKKPTASTKALIENLAADVTDKLTTYPDLRVRVVVDMSGSGPGAAALVQDLAESKRAMITELKQIEHAILSRLPQVDVVLPGDVVVTIDGKDLA